MYKVVHVDDNPDFRKRIANALNGIPGMRLVQHKHLGDFLNARSWDARLYVSDRHFPSREGAREDDESWRSLSKCLQTYDPAIPIILLCRHLPRDWRQYRNIREAMGKSNFNEEQFADKVLGYLNESKGGLKNV